MKNLLYILFVLLTFTTTNTFAQCTTPTTDGTSWYVSGTHHRNWNQYAGSDPTIGVGSRVTISGIFSGITPQSFDISYAPVYTTQNIAIFIDNLCNQAVLNSVSNTLIDFQMPTNITAGNHTIYLVKNSGGTWLYKYKVTKSVARWSAAMRFNTQDLYAQTNRVFGYVFAFNTTNGVRNLGPINPNVPITMTPGIVPGDTLYIFLTNVTGTYKGSDSIIASASFGSAASPAVQVVDAYNASPGITMPFRGDSYVNIQVPSIVVNSTGIFTLTLTVNGSSTPVTAQLWF